MPLDLLQQTKAALLNMRREAGDVLCIKVDGPGFPGRDAELKDEAIVGKLAGGG